MIKKIAVRVLAGFILIVLVTITSIVLFIRLSPQFGALPSGEHLERINRSDNFNNGVFVNLIPTSMDLDFRQGMGVMYEWVFESNERIPGQPLPVKFNMNEKLRSSAARVTWFGHSAIMLEIDSKRLLIDPMLGDAAAPVPFLSRRFRYEKPIPIETLEYVDAVIFSHDHYDHLDYQTIKRIKDKVGHFYAPLGVGAHLQLWGVDAAKVTELDWWESSSMLDIRLTAAPARHFSGRGISDRNKTQWASWVIEGSREKIYFSGDSGYGPQFKQIGERFGPFDFAMMECGQYDERWEAIHMMPEQTVQASIDLGAARMMPIHWSAFNLSLHNWTDPVERAVKAGAQRQLDVVTPFIGQTFAIDDQELGHRWWRVLLRDNPNKR